MASSPSSPSVENLPPDPGNRKLHVFRVEFLPKDTTSPFNVPSALKAVFHQMVSVDSSISFISADNTVIDLSSFPTSTFSDHFKLEQHPRYGGLTKLVVCFSAQTFHSSGYFKKSLRPWLHSTHTWLHDHTFGDKINIVDLGYLFCRHPFRTYRVDLISDLRSFFSTTLSKASFDDPDLPSSLPHFELQRRRITHNLKATNRLPNESNRIQVDTFVLRCSSEDTPLFLSIIQDEPLPSSLGVFSPASIRSPTHHDLLTDLIREHTHFLVKSKFLTIQGLPTPSLTDDLRLTLTEHLPQARIERTSASTTEGIWYILYVGPAASPDALQHIDSTLSNLARHPDEPLKQARLAAPSFFDPSHPRRLISRTNRLESMASAIHKRNNSRQKFQAPVPKFITPTRNLQLSFADSEDLTLGSAQQTSASTPVTTNTRPPSDTATTNSQLTMESIHSTLLTVAQTLQQDHDRYKEDRARYTKAIEDLQRQQNEDRTLLHSLIQDLKSSSSSTVPRKIRRSHSGQNMDLEPSASQSPSPAASPANLFPTGPANHNPQNGKV